MLEFAPADEFGIAKDFEATRGIHVSPNDQVERRAVAPTQNEAGLFQSSTPSLAHRRRYPRDRSNRLLDVACASA